MHVKERPVLTLINDKTDQWTHQPSLFAATVSAKHHPVDLFQVANCTPKMFSKIPANLTFGLNGTETVIVAFWLIPIYCGRNNLLQALLRLPLQPFKVLAMSLGAPVTELIFTELLGYCVHS